MADPWTVLGVEPTASWDAARHAYLLRAQLVHPDRHRGAPPDVVAEAERSMRELNDAWEEVQRRLVGGSDAGAAGDRGGSAAGGSAAPADPPSWVTWVIRNVEDAARSQGDPMSEAESERLRTPIAGLPAGRDLERWLRRRRVTLRQAMAGGDPLDWQRAWRVLIDADVRIVLLLLLDPSRRR